MKIHGCLKKHVTVGLTPELYEALQCEAERQRLSMSDLLRRLLVYYCRIVGRRI